MRKSVIFKKILVIILMILTMILQAQNQVNSKANTQSAAGRAAKALQNYGPDDLLYRGLLYIPDHPKAKNHPYFTGNEWNRGSVSLAGENFIGLDLKYNVNLNLVILKMQGEGSNAHQAIILGNDLIDSFTIDNVTFTNLGHLDSTGKLDGFGQLIFNDNFIFYKSFSKDFLNQYSQSNPYGSYSRLNTTYYIFKEGKKTRIGNKRALINYFKPIKKPLRKYMRQEDFKFKSASKQAFYQLLNFCENHLSTISH